MQVIQLAELQIPPEVLATITEGFVYGGPAVVSDAARKAFQTAYS